MRNYIGIQFSFHDLKLVAYSGEIAGVPYIWYRVLQDDLSKKSMENINHTLRQRIVSLEYNVRLLQYRERMLRSNCIGQDKAIKRLKHKLREFAPKPSWETRTRCVSGTVTESCK